MALARQLFSARILKDPTVFPLQRRAPADGNHKLIREEAAPEHGHERKQQAGSVDHGVERHDALEGMVDHRRLAQGGEVLAVAKLAQLPHLARDLKRHRAFLVRQVGLPEAVGALVGVDAEEQDLVEPHDRFQRRLEAGLGDARDPLERLHVVQRLDDRAARLLRQPQHRPHRCEASLDIVVELPARNVEKNDQRHGRKRDVVDHADGEHGVDREQRVLQIFGMRKLRRPLPEANHFRLGAEERRLRVSREWIEVVHDFPLEIMYVPCKDNITASRREVGKLVLAVSNWGHDCPEFPLFRNIPRLKRVRFHGKRKRPMQAPAVPCRIDAGAAH